MRRVLVVFGIGLVVLSAMVANGGLVFANGAPIRVVLSYLDGVSNTGPKTASGTAEVVMAEGQVSLNVAGLPRLGNESYTVWLIKSGGDIVLNAGSFNTNEAGSATVTNVLPSDIPDKGYNMLILTVEPAGAQATKPGPKVSIGGRFPVKGPSYELPARLPNTGGSLVNLEFLAKMGIAGLLVLAAGMGVRKATRP